MQVQQSRPPQQQHTIRNGVQQLLQVQWCTVHGGAPWTRSIYENAVVDTRLSFVFMPVRLLLLPPDSDAVSIGHFDQYQFMFLLVRGFQSKICYFRPSRCWQQSRGSSIHTLRCSLSWKYPHSEVQSVLKVFTLWHAMFIEGSHSLTCLTLKCHTLEVQSGLKVLKANL